LNDSKNPLGSHKDRHESLGAGFIGWDAIKKIVRHPALRRLPFYLETPSGILEFEREIGKIKSFSSKPLPLE
jgi:deoxyribonuclease-4